MAYQFADGFDNYGNAYTLTSGYPWDTVSGSMNTTTADVRFAPPGSLPGGSAQNSSGGAAYLLKNLSSNQGTLVVGFGVKTTNLPSSPTDIMHFSDAGTTQLTLAMTSTGGLQFYRGNLATAIGTLAPNNTITAGAWYGLAMQVVIAGGTAGSVQLYVNGNATPIINNTGLNTSADGNAFANQVAIGLINTNGQGIVKYDDFYCFDTTSGFLNSLLSGDARILTKMPASAGNYTNWTPTGLTNNWQNAAVTPPSTADYNANNVSTTKDSYTTQSASLAVAPYFVVARASLERDDAGTHNPSIFLRSSSTDSAGVVTPTLTSSYIFYDAVFQNDPATSSAWTGPGADNAQVGVIEG